MRMCVRHEPMGVIKNLYFLFSPVHQERTNKSDESYPMMMARPRRRLLAPLRRWWMSKSDSHFQIITYTTILSVAATLWGFLFLFILDGTADPSKSAYVSWSWAALIFGGLIAFYVVPEFSIFLNQKSVLDSILSLDSRPEVLRRRGEAEEAALMLGIEYQKTLVSHYESLGIKTSGKLRHVSKSMQKKQKLSVIEDELVVDSENEQSALMKWLNTRDSHLSRILPGAPVLHELIWNRLILIFSGLTGTLLLYNMMFGLASIDGGSREYTVDLTLFLSGNESIHSLAPHFDGVSIILTATSLTLLYLTRPAGEIKIEWED